MEQNRSLTLDGISYDLAQFSDGVQQLVAIYHRLNSQLQDHQLEVMKSQAAMQQVSNQIAEQVRKELDEKRSAAKPAEDVTE